MSESRRASYLPAETLKGGHGEEFELNLAPVIDCLTVLIVYTMISASFLSLGIFGATVPSESRAAVSTAVPVQLRVSLKADHTLEVVLSGQERMNRTLAASNGDWDFAKLGDQLTEIKSKWEALNTVTVTAYPGIEYRDVVRTIERAKRTLPHVVLGD